MSINNVIINELKQKKLTQKQLAEYIKIPASTINNWLKLERSIPAEYIIPISEFLNITPEYLLTGINLLNKDRKKIIVNEKNISDIFMILSDKHKERIYERIETYLELEEYQLYENSNITYLDDYKKRPFKDFAITMSGLTAAGQAIMYPDLYSFSDIVEVPQGIRADFALTVKGDSMEPQIQNGSIIYVKKTEYVENGTISIIELDGAVTCKKFYKFSDRIELISINSQYKPIIIKESDHIDIKIIGKVVF